MPTLVSAIQDALLAEFGKSASISPYVRQDGTAMAVVLDEVERQIGARFDVYWVKNAPPEVFCLPGFTPSPVVFSNRYLSLTAIIRSLLVGPFEGDVLTETAEKISFKVIAEMALRHGDPDYAAIAFAKSVTTSSRIHVMDLSEEQLELESPPNESTMVEWFFGLAHELGHLHPNQSDRIDDRHWLSDTDMLEMIQQAIDQFVHFPESMRHDAFEKAKQLRSTSVLGIDNVRSESLADIFATGVLFQASLDLTRESKSRQFDVVQFIEEIIIFRVILGLIERYRRIATLATAGVFDREAVFEGLVLHPMSIHVRAQILRKYLAIAVAGFLSNSFPTQEQAARIAELTDEIEKHYREKTRAIDEGVTRAMNFLMFPERRENDWMVLEALRQHYLSDPTTIIERLSIPYFGEAKRFLEMADSLGVDGKLMRTLMDLVDDPSKPLHPNPTEGQSYYLLWVMEKNGLTRPYGPDSEDGQLIFVFDAPSELFDAFFEKVASVLEPDLTLAMSRVSSPNKMHFVHGVAEKITPNQSFRFVFEGTKEFEHRMKSFMGK